MHSGNQVQDLAWEGGNLLANLGSDAHGHFDIGSI